MQLVTEINVLKSKFNMVWKIGPLFAYHSSVGDTMIGDQIRASNLKIFKITILVSTGICKRILHIGQFVNADSRRKYFQICHGVSTGQAKGSRGIAVSGSLELEPLFLSTDIIHCWCLCVCMGRGSSAPKETANHPKNKPRSGNNCVFQQRRNNFCWLTRMYYCTAISSAIYTGKKARVSGPMLCKNKKMLEEPCEKQLLQEWLLPGQLLNKSFCPEFVWTACKHRWVNKSELNLFTTIGTHILCAINK